MSDHIIPLFQFVQQVRQLPAKADAASRIRHFAQIYSQFSPDAARQQSERCIDCGNPYCEWRCPVHNYIPQWLRLVAEDKILEAADLAYSTNSMPEICGLVCPQSSLCEGACTLAAVPGAVTIGAIENYLIETAIQRGWRPTVRAVESLAFRVAIIGAGPAGLACADRLARWGIRSVVYERQPEIGGLLTFGIPEFKLDKQLVKRRRQFLEDMGVVFHTGVTIGIDHSIDDLLAANDLIFLGTGAQQGLRANIPGESLVGVEQALPFLVRQISAHLGYEAVADDLRGQVVLVLGGGDTAMDCCRTAIRLGAAAVRCLYRRGEADLHNSEKDFYLAREEGVEFCWYSQAVACQGQQQVDSVLVRKTRINDAGQIEILADEERMVADRVIIAYGFEAEPISWLQGIGVQTNARGLLQVQAPDQDFQTHHPRIYAGGDAVLGANLVVNAIAQGQQAALQMYRQLTQQDNH